MSSFRVPGKHAVRNSVVATTLREADEGLVRDDYPLHGASDSNPITKGVGLMPSLRTIVLACVDFGLDPAR
jgi:hypothetical protein